ncbi:MAG: 16S rRNA (uracil(1498)-N(3))-methyltransferase, partial [Gemmataceae bacterium]|nr:16S rRNA (uracil(1498)-N(3))-methyltransferase [Gemmataceae bacterium]
AEEIPDARDNGWELMNLGPRTLRIETAALTAVARWSDPLRLSPSPPSAAAAESQAASDGTPLETGLDRAGLRSP